MGNVEARNGAESSNIGLVRGLEAQFTHTLIEEKLSGGSKVRVEEHGVITGQKLSHRLEELCKLGNRMVSGKLHDRHMKIMQIAPGSVHAECTVNVFSHSKCRLIVTSLESQEVAHGEHAIVSCDDEFKEAKDGLKSMEEIKTPINVMGKEMCKVEEVVGGELGLKGLVDIDIQYDVEEFRKE
ncbi:hypothetical protein VNO78_19822 [Psophocarpus tetragonolobus]|uniref:Uncharacterized protein n=1 Tax=Psophocarpus tetragonolobus TaxID=3891 RepID=A0AAN9S8S2_PSOTE